MTNPGPVAIGDCLSLDSIASAAEKLRKASVQELLQQERAKTATMPPGFEWVRAEECDANHLAALRYAVDEAGSRPVYLYGSVGVGKSALAAVLCMERQGKWLAAQDAIAWVQKARMDGNVVLPGAMYEAYESDLWKRWSRPHLLVVDDIGISGFTEQQYAILCKLADVRQKLPTIYTSNLTREQLTQAYDPRITSRVCCGRILEIVGADRRQAEVKKYTSRPKP